LRLSFPSDTARPPNDPSDEDLSESPEVFIGDDQLECLSISDAVLLNEIAEILVQSLRFVFHVAPSDFRDSISADTVD
jgi:hypothetical protein